MVVYSFYVFDRHGKLSIGQNKRIPLTTYDVAECIYKKRWAPRPGSSSKSSQSNGLPQRQSQSKSLSAEDDAKLVFGTIFSLRNLVRKLGGPEDKYIAPAKYGNMLLRLTTGIV